jgi:hypothetical protein
MSDNNTKDDNKKDKNNPPLAAMAGLANAAEQQQQQQAADVSRMFDMWAEVLKMPTIGPMYAFSKDFVTYANEVAALGKIMAEMKAQLDRYWSMVNAAYAKASTDMAKSAPRQLATKEDFDGYRKAMIEAFEDAFTGLYASPEFSATYGKLFSAQLDMSRTLQSMTERNLKALNLPTRSEIDEMLKDIHELKRSVRELKKGLEGATRQ